MKLHFPEPQTVKLRHMQTRMEKHGEDDQPAMDLSISLVGSNLLLDMLHGELRAMFFRPVGDGVPAGELDLPVDDRPTLRVPGIKCPIKFDREHVGMTLRVAYGATGKADIVLGAVKLHKVQVVELIEGGSCRIQFTLSTTDVSEKAIGKLSLLQGHEISIVLTLPEVEDQQPLPDPTDIGLQPADKTPQPSAEDIFTAGANQ